MKKYHLVLGEMNIVLILRNLQHDLCKPILNMQTDLQSANFTATYQFKVRKLFLKSETVNGPKLVGLRDNGIVVWIHDVLVMNNHLV